MAFDVYSGPNIWLIVPDCMQASWAANVRFGPLRLCGRARTEDLGLDELSVIETRLNEQSFAEISEALAQRLLAGLPRAH